MWVRGGGELRGVIVAVFIELIGVRSMRPSHWLFFRVRITNVSFFNPNDEMKGGRFVTGKMKK